MSVKMSLAPNPTLAVWPFPHVRRIGDTLYVGLQLPTDDDADIETQTHESFGALANILESEGSSMQDLMKLHTYYVYEGEGGRDVTEYWERMTDVEAEQVNAAMATQPFRTRQIFLTANTFRSDHELWPLLVSIFFVHKSTASCGTSNLYRFHCFRHFSK